MQILPPYPLTARGTGRKASHLPLCTAAAPPPALPQLRPCCLGCTSQRGAAGSNQSGLCMVHVKEAAEPEWAVMTRDSVGKAWVPSS